MGRRVPWTMAAVAAGALLVGACSTADESSGESSAPAADQETPTLSEGDAAGGVQAQAVGLEDAVSAEPLPNATRAIVYTAKLDVGVDDVDAAAARATRTVARAGGFVFDQVADLEGKAEITVTYKVPPDRFDEVVADLSDLGDLHTRDIASDDVTGEVVDLEARLATAQASAERLRGLLAGAGSVGELVSVEQALAQREAEVEALSARLRTLDAQVDLGTVTLRLTEQAKTDKNDGGDGIPGFVAGLKTGARAFVSVAQGVATVAGFLLPFLAVGAAVSLPVFVLVRRRRRPAHAS